MFIHMRIKVLYVIITLFHRFSDLEIRITVTNSWGKCLTLDSQSNYFVVGSACDQFVFTETNRLRHIISGKCLIPESLSSNSKITLTSNCDDDYSIFQNTDTMNLKHVLTGYCLQASEETDDPSIGTSYILHPNCPDLLRTRFLLNYTGKLSQLL